MTSITAPARPWLITLGWLIGIVLFIRLTEILPCCRPASFEHALRDHDCRQGLGGACPSYDDCAPR